MTATKTRKKKRPLPPKPKQRKDLPINAEYEARAKGDIREALVETDTSYEELAERLNEMGIDISARGLENKISRGSFSAAFYLQCMEALDVE